MTTGNPESASQSKLTRPELILLFILAGVQFTHILDFMILMPLGPQLMRLFAITPQQFGFVVSAYTYSAGVSGFLSAFIIDRFDRKTALLISYTGFTIGTIACGLAPTYMILLIVRSVTGAFGGVLGALIMSIIGDTIHPSKRGRAMGLTMSSFSAASVFGVPFGLALAARFSWHAPFLFAGGVAALLNALIVFKVPSMSRHLEGGRPAINPIRTLKLVAADSNQVQALLFTVLLFLSHFLLIPFISAYMVANVGFKESQLPWIYFIGGGLTIFTSPLVGRLADRVGKPKVFTVAGLLLVIPYIGLTHLGPSPIAVALAITSLFFVIGNARFIPAMAMVTATVRPETRGSFMSLNSSVQSLASGTAAFVSGLIVQKAASGELTHYNYVGYLACLLSTMALVFGRKLKSVEF